LFEDELIAVTLIWGFVFIYAVMATMDFGAGFWSMVYINREQTKATNIANRYLSPTWEVTNVFIVAIVVAIVSLFPKATYTLGTVLLIPGSMILLLLSLRSAFLVFSHVADEYEKVLTYVSGICGILIPGLLISVLPITHGNFIKVVNGVQQLELGKLFTSPNEYAFIGFAISSTLFLSSLLLADFSKVAEEWEAYKVYRKGAIITGPILLLMSLLIVITLQIEAPWLYKNMLAHVQWLIISVAMFGLAGAALIFPNQNAPVSGKPRLAVIAITIQYFLASYVYGRAHLPYIVYPSVTIQSGFTNQSNFHAVFAMYIVGFIILFPGFFYFWRLFMKDKSYIRHKRT
jgi:cytochrome bd ubiquinol oxidase subunit II